MNNDNQVLFVMGVSGSGKTTIGKLLAKKLDVPFFDGDNYHPPANVEKMAKGHPLNDKDRKGWLQRLNRLAQDHQGQGAVIACSALKKQYRQTLVGSMEDTVEFVYLDGSFELISRRLQARRGHFMPPGLLRSQFETLEIPDHVIAVSIDADPEEIVADICARLDR